MLTAVAADFAAAGHLQVVLVDERLSDGLRAELPSQAQLVSIAADSELPDVLRRTAAECDRVLLIAPESGGCLLQTLDWLDAFGDRMVSPGREFVRLSSDKNATAEWLNSKQVPTTSGMPLPETPEKMSLPLPVVIKPIDGAGSEQVQLFETLDAIDWPEHPDRFRVESFVAGASVSVGVIASASDGGSPKFQFLPPTGQLFDADPIGTYIGSRYPLPADIATRATALAERAARSLPPTGGYFGIDIVVADAGPDHDTVIEVNPRLTTSYVKLREIVTTNLAEMMLG